MATARLPGPGDKTVPDVPVNSYPLDRRMVNTNSRTAAFLRYAGLKSTDVHGAGPWVTLAEAEAEAARRNIVVDLPDPLSPLAEAEARRIVRLLHKLGGHLMRLEAGQKSPVESTWQHAAALTETEAVAWLVGGGNLGINLLRSGPNGWLVLDAENAAATALLTSAGFMRTARTANSQDPTTNKVGGCHVWMPLPDGTDPTTLRSTLQLSFEGGGLMDVLVGARYIVGPGSRLDSAPGVRYELDPGWLEAMRADAGWAPVIAELEAG